MTALIPLEDTSLPHVVMQHVCRKAKTAKFFNMVDHFTLVEMTDPFIITGLSCIALRISEVKNFAGQASVVMEILWTKFLGILCVRVQ